ncbi:putative RNA polymerase sigma factor containing a TPR repeat domain [Mycolicibacterium aurum]|uniref:RNA polymerase sigma factor n=2 Tax=Mycolicibacterium aurum TaxID=1791 RepID=A0A448IGS1_MYCAU|nr:putative RNA polymerase sigma factor containing a TPR repeat domain [Mycolicibacterium aurum]
MAPRGATLAHNGSVPAPDTVQHTVDAVWRMESAKIVATLTRAVGDVGLAEDLAQEALLAALTQWPGEGVPRNPGAWLTAIAKRKAIDHWRRQDNLDAKYAVLARDLESHVDDPWDPDRIDDDVLRLIFMAAHPSLSRENQIALTLRVVGGLTTDEIANAFLVPKATVAQRIVRAKKALAGVPFEVPGRADFPARLSSVLSVIYLVFNEGYSASSGPRWIRDELCSEALRLGRVLAALTPDEAEVHGLVALMEFQSSRLRARTDRDGAPILLEQQNRATWDRAQIQRGVASLQHASDLLQRSGTGWGNYTLQAALAECHAVAPTAADTDWARIVSLYDALLTLAPSPVVQLNRAIAVAMADPQNGPPDALAIVDRLQGLDGSYLIPSVRGELLSRLGRSAEAAAAFERAAELVDNEREREVLRNKAAQALGT